MKRVLVTGGAGFIGSHLVDALLAADCEVTVLDDLSTGRAGNLQHLSRDPRLHYVQGSVGDARQVAAVCKDVDAVYHLAAAVGVALVASRPVESIERNIEPTRMLLERLCEEQKRGKAVKLFLASTSEVYGKNPKATWTEDDDLVFGPTTKPRWSYGMSKAIDEFLALGRAASDGLPVVIGRFFNVVGPRQTGTYGMVLPRFVEAALANQPLRIHGDGTQTRCFAHVSDVIAAITALMQTPAAVGQVINIGSDQPVSIHELARRVISRTGSRSEIQFQSYESAFGKNFEDILHRVPDVRRLQAVLGFKPERSLDSTIDDVVGWVRGKTN